MTINSFHGQFGFLSNFYGEGSNTVEHLFQSDKTLDENWRRTILEALTPGKAKRLARKVPMRSDWDKIKISVMTYHVTAKFDNIELALKLTDTYPEELIEGNRWHDNFWGDCSCPKCINVKGQNHLGKILMKIREDILESQRLT